MLTYITLYLSVFNTITLLPTIHFLVTGLSLIILFIAYYEILILEKNVLKINNVPIKLICHMHDPDKMLSPQRLTLLPDSKNFLVDGQTGSYRESSSMYGGTYYLDDIKIKWRLDRYTGGISYDISRGGEQMYQTGECQNSSNQGTKF